MENKSADCGIIVTQQQSGNQKLHPLKPRDRRASSYEPKRLGLPGWLGF